MLTGKTSTGFAWNIEEDALDDMELLDALVESDKGNGAAISDVTRLLLGEKQRAALYDHLRGENGRVRATAAVTAVNEILAAIRDGKKS